MNHEHNSEHGALLGASDIRRIAALEGIRPTKKFGQNFVIDPGTVRKIVRTAGITPEHTVMEVGPGLGSLTLAILETGAELTVVEIDPALAQRLPQTIHEYMPSASDRLHIVLCDALKVQAEQVPALQQAERFSLVANLPYNVATPIIITLLERFPQLSDFVVMVQKEVADRLTADPGSRIYGTPSVKLQWFGQSTKAGTIGRNVFWPAPNVDSALVSFTRTHTDTSDEEIALREHTFRIIDAAFAARRKTLHAALRHTIHPQALEQAGIDPSARGETLTCAQFTDIARADLALRAQDDADAQPDTSANADTIAPADTDTYGDTDTSFHRAIVRVECPAKTNLTLTVGAPQKQWDGRHEVDTLYCALSLTDTVELRELPAGTPPTLELEGSHLGDLSDIDIESNHAIRALRLLSAACDHEPNVVIHITKRIPVGAGLAGGSTDAAGTLLGLRELWGLTLSTHELEQIGAKLGADMAFCIRGGIARGTGFGERIEPLTADDLPMQYRSMLGTVLIGAYSDQLSTPVVYRTFDDLQISHSGQSNTTVPNMLQPAAIELHPRSGQAISYALQAGASAAFVSGSGPTVIACIPSLDADTNPASYNTSYNHEIADRITQLWLEHGVVDRVERCTMPATPHIMRVNIAD